MYLRDLVASLLRRWPLLLCAITITAAAGFFTVKAVPAEYETTASALLVPPKSTDDPGANRYLALGGLNQMTTVLIRSLNSDETHADVQALETSGEYVVESDWTTSAPILIIRGTAANPAVAERLVSAILAQVPSSLQDLQDRINVEPDARIVSLELASDAEPTTKRKPQIRALLAVSVGLFGSLVLAISSLDGFLLRRRRQEEKRADRLDDMEHATAPDMPEIPSSLPTSPPKPKTQPVPPPAPRVSALTSSRKK